MRDKNTPIKNSNGKIVNQYLNDKGLSQYEKLDAIKRHAQTIE